MATSFELLAAASASVIASLLSSLAARPNEEPSALNERGLRCGGRAAGTSGKGWSSEVYPLRSSKAIRFCSTQMPPSAGLLCSIEVVDSASTRCSYRLRKSKYMDRSASWEKVNLVTQDCCLGGQ